MFLCGLFGEKHIKCKYSKKIPNVDFESDKIGLTREQIKFLDLRYAFVCSRKPNSKYCKLTGLPKNYPCIFVIERGKDRFAKRPFFVKRFLEYEQQCETLRFNHSPGGSR